MSNEANGPTGSRFTAEYPKEAIATLDGLVASKTPIFVMPAWHLSTEAAQVGLLLSRMISLRSGRQDIGTYRSFFANSSYEAIHAAIKLMRHQRCETRGDHAGRVLVLDAEHGLSARVDPLGQGPELALIPNVVFARELSLLERALSERNWCGAIIRSVIAHPLASLAKLAEKLRLANIPVTLDLTDSDLSETVAPVLKSIRPDIVLVGERLTGRQVPFAAVCGTSAAFAVWSQPNTAFLHTNTYGGNTLAMRLVRDHLLAMLPREDVAHDALARAQAERQYAVTLYKTHVNPVTAEMHRALGGTLNVVRAEGARLTVELDSGKTLQLVDALCAGGLGLNGHNPDDARTVLREHDSRIDYTKRLEGKLTSETGLSRTFPAVSGATAVEIAITLAMLAKPARRKIIVFNHNYGGKTLISLLATAAERSRRPFAPLYADVCYLDPFAADAVESFKREIEGGGVALVWLEIVHGSSESFAPLPDALLRAVSEERSRTGYLVGVDEVLMSYFRCGRRFSHLGRLDTVDLISLSKALSYLCFPTGAAVVSEEVYQAARNFNRKLVDDLKDQYRNDLGAHFALHALSQVDVLDLAERSRVVSERLQRAAGKARSSRGIARCYSEGLFVRFEVKPPRLPGPLRAVAAAKLPLLVMIWWIWSARVLALYDCMGPHLISGENEVQRIEAGLERLARMSPLSLFVQSLGFQFAQTVARMVRGLRASSFRTRRRPTPLLASGAHAGRQLRDRDPAATAPAAAPARDIDR